MTDNKDMIKNGDVNPEVDTEDEEREVVTIEYEDGTEEEYLVEGVVEVSGSEYIVLIAVKQEDSMVFYKIVGEGENEDWVPVESEEEYNAVIAELRECGYNVEINE